MISSEECSSGILLGVRPQGPYTFIPYKDLLSYVNIFRDSSPTIYPHLGSSHAKARGPRGPLHRLSPVRGMVHGAALRIEEPHPLLQPGDRAAPFPSQSRGKQTGDFSDSVQAVPRTRVRFLMPIRRDEKRRRWRDQG